MTKGLPLERSEPASLPATNPNKHRTRVFRVSELTSAIRIELESRFTTIWVEGEISNCRVWKTGHLYFTLKDSDAQVRGVMFRSSVKRLRFEIEDGLQVLVRGRISVYAPKGEYQLIADNFEPQGLGARQLEFDQLRSKLEKEGLFDLGRKRSLPLLPRIIGIVTSLDGAAIQDIVTVLRRRHPNSYLIIAPAKVQGEGSELEIVRGLKQLQSIESLDVVILGRGGGSSEDLWSFNDERVVRAIAASSIPVVSAVGHETDYTLSDYASDLRAPTPSAAAELVLSRKDELVDRINLSVSRLSTATQGRIEKARAFVYTTEHRPGFSSWPSRLLLRSREIDELHYRITNSVRDFHGKRDRQLTALHLRLETLNLRRQLDEFQARFLTAQTFLGRAIRDALKSYRGRLTTVISQLDSLSPLNVLARGYAICWNDDRSIILRHANRIAIGESVRVKLHQGELRCKVEESN